MINQLKNKISFMLLCALVAPQLNIHATQPSSSNNSSWFWGAAGIVACVGGYFGYQWYQKNNTPHNKFLRAVARGDEAVVTELIKESGPGVFDNLACSFVNRKDEDGRAALAHAAINGQEAMVGTLLKARADVNTKSNCSVTPLHYAVEYNNQPIVNKLIESRAQVDAQTRDGSTPLHYAYRNNNTVIGGGLIAAGANQNLQNNRQETPQQHGMNCAAQRAYNQGAQDQAMIRAASDVAFALGQASAASHRNNNS